ncbi:MAG TPA: 50S ribosomal protein L11 methyltransferase [Casimicrobiaceae bacterium]|jgi:ribosomal protein L11 methyltransferase
MSFVALRFDVEAADGDRWSDALLAAGARSVEAIDPRAGTVDEEAVFAESVDAGPAWWPVTRLTAICDANVAPALIVQAAADSIAQNAPAFETFAVAEQDWVQVTQAQFKPIRVADRFWIVPSWCEPPQAGALDIVLDPGVAFGTGAHATTRLCLLWLKENVAPGASVLDYGCGSGILAIAAAKLGAGRVVGADIDPQAVLASIGNGRVNAVTAEFTLVDVLAPRRFAIVVANILANPLRLLAPALAGRTDADGLIALCGILASQADEVAAAYAPWFDLATWRRDDDWVLLSGVRRGTSS